MLAPLHAREIGRHQSERQEGRQVLACHPAQRRLRLLIVPAGEVAHVGERGAQARRDGAGHRLVPADAMGFQQIQRHEALAAPGMQREGAQQPGHRIGDAGMAGRLGGSLVGGAGQHQRRQPDQGRGGLAGIAFEIVHARHRIVIEIEDAGIDQCEQRFLRQMIGGDGIEQRRRHRIGGNVAARLADQRVVPPLQPHLAGHRIGDGLAHPRHFDVERMQREQRVTPLRRGEQVGDIAVAVERADQLGAVRDGGGIGHGSRLNRVRLRTSFEARLRRAPQDDVVLEATSS